VHILVALRLVPDLSGDVELTPDGADLDRDWLDLKLNEFDDHALEEALLIKEQSKARVTAVALDVEGIDKTLQIALARGADAALKIAADGELASRESAPLFAAAARDLSADLFFTGVQTPEDLFGHLAPFVAAQLDWPSFSAVSRVRIEGGDALVQQEYSGGSASIFRVSTPAAIGVQTASRPLRYVAGSQLRQFSGTKIETIDVSANISAASGERLRFQRPTAASAAAMIEGDTETIAGRLRAMLVERGLIKEVSA
jgi:electron transfer flavoprotein beta subunit